MSQGYTRKSAVELALEHGKVWFRSITKWILLGLNLLISILISLKYAAGPKADGKINDLFFIANKNNMRKLVESFNHIESLEDLNIDETGGTIAPSYHRLCETFKKVNLLKDVEYILGRGVIALGLVTLDY